MVLGKMGWTPAEFYNSTLADIRAAVDGWMEAEQEKWQWQRYNVRELIYWTSQFIPRERVKEPEQLFKLPMDDEIKRTRHKHMPRAEIIKPDGTKLR